jgi:PAS domain S-box-containing protein
LIKILHVEPDIGIRAFIKQRLEELNPELKIESVDSSIETISTYSSNNFDLILVHYSPLINPIELTRTLKKIKNKPIVFYSTEGEETGSNQYLDTDADFSFILKMSREESIHLINKIQTLVEKGRIDELNSTILNSEINAIVVEYEGKIIYVNTLFKRLFLNNNEDINGKTILSFVSESEKEKLQNLLQKGGEGIIDITKEGHTHHYKIWIMLSTLSENKLIIGILQDTKTENVYEQRLRLLHELSPKILNERNIDNLVDTTLNIIETILDSEVSSFFVVEGNELVCLDRRWKKRSIKLQLKEENIITRSVRDGISITNSDLLKEKLFKDDLIIESELSVPIKNKDAVIAVLDLRSSKPGKFQQEDIFIVEALGRYVSCTYSIITELQSIANSERKYHDLLESLGEAIYIFTDTQYLYVNQRGAELLGYNHISEIIGKSISSHISQKNIDQLKEILEGRLSSRQISNYEMKISKLDGSVLELDVFASTIVFEGKSCNLIIERDITNFKLMQEQLKKYTSYLEAQVEKRNEELQEAQQFASAGKLASMVGHDLRSPLQSIKNATYLIQKQPERSEEMLTSINSSVDRALSMLEDLRYKTMETSLKIEPIEINKLIKDTLQETLFPENITIQTNLDPDLTIVSIDSQKIRRVLDNIIKNAVEAMSIGGKIIVESKSDDKNFILSIADTGVGISQDHLTNLFKPFYTTKSNGLGLGLAYCYKAIEAHGGTIKVESVIDKGTTFKIILKKSQPSTKDGSNNK